MKDFVSSLSMPKLLVLTIVMSAGVGFWVGGPQQRPSQMADPGPPPGMPFMPPAPPVGVVPPPLEGPGEAVQPLQVWQGRLPHGADPASAASGRLIADAREWRTLWSGLRGAERLPAVNFDRDIIVLATLDRSNFARLNLLRGPGGRIHLVCADRLPGNGVCYVFARFRKDRFERLRRRPVPAPRAS